MIKQDILADLRCPETHQTLTHASAETISALNKKIAAGQLKNRAGEVIKEPIEAGLVRADGQFLYPIRNGLPVMLIDQAIPVI